MKNILYLLRSLGLYKLLTGAGIAAMLALLFLGPTMLRASQRIVITNPTSKTTQTGSNSVTGTTGATNGAAGGFDSSTFNVTPITNPDGTISYPTYTIPATTPTSGDVTAVAAPDPSKCTAAQAAMDQIDAGYANQNGQLQTEIKNTQDQIMSISQYAAGQYGTGYTPPDTAPLQAKIQRDNAVLIANVQAANTKKAPYQTILVQNQCRN